MRTKAGLEDNFQSAVTAFNNQNLDGLMQYLSDQVSVYSISEHNGHYTKKDARAYFESQFADKPNFALPLEKVIININAAKNAAFMSGQTIWKDTHTPDGENLLFAFTFVYDATNDRWQFSTMWGAVD